MKKNKIKNAASKRFEKRVSTLEEIKGELSVELNGRHETVFGAMFFTPDGRLTFCRTCFADCIEDFRILYTGLCGIADELGIMEK